MFTSGKQYHKLTPFPHKIVAPHDSFAGNMRRLYLP